MCVLVCVALSVCSCCYVCVHCCCGLACLSLVFCLLVVYYGLSGVKCVRVFYVFLLCVFLASIRCYCFLQCVYQVLIALLYECLLLFSLRSFVCYGFVVLIDVYRFFIFCVGFYVCVFFYWPLVVFLCLCYCVVLSVFNCFFLCGFYGFVLQWLLLAFIVFIQFVYRPLFVLLVSIGCFCLALFMCYCVCVLFFCCVFV